MNSEISSENKKKIIGLLRVLFPTAKIYLYGSRARGTQSEYSDIDLALDNGEQISLRNMYEAKSILTEADIDCFVDLVDINRIPQSLRKAIEKEMILWS